MRILVVASLTMVFLSACGTNQTEQLSNSEPLVTKDETQVISDQPSSTDMSASMSSTESNTSGEGVQDPKVEETNAMSETTSDNPMMKDTGIQTENAEVKDDKSMEAMDSENKDIAKDKETTEKQIVDEKG